MGKWRVLYKRFFSDPRHCVRFWLSPRNLGRFRHIVHAMPFETYTSNRNSYGISVGFRFPFVVIVDRHASFPFPPPRYRTPFACNTRKRLHGMKLKTNGKDFSFIQRHPMSKSIFSDWAQKMSFLSYEQPKILLYVLETVHVTNVFL